MNKQQELRIYKELKALSEQADTMNKYQKLRYNTMVRYWKAREKNPGALACIEELLSMKDDSRKYYVSQRIIDCYANIDGKTTNCERKTSGGRIEALERSTMKYVVYSMDFNQKHKASKKHGEYIEYRRIEPVIIPRTVFLNALYRFGAIKSTNGKRPERAIQVSNKPFYEWLKEWPIPYDKYALYLSSDFEGLE